MEVATVGSSHAHSDCQPVPHDVQEELQKGPRGADGQPIRKLIEYFSSSSPHFQIEMRPNKRVQPNNQKLDSAELNENNIPGTKRLTGEESWTKIKPVKLDPKLARAMKDNLGADSKEHKQTELHEVRQINPSVFIGMDVVKRRPVITDKNPHVEGLQDSHKCIYLPSSMDKNQYLPSYLSQNVLFMELPSAPLYTPGIAPGLFFVTPRLAGCNIFVAHDPAIHKYWILRISSKNPYLPPDLEKQREEEAAARELEKNGKPVEVKEPTTKEKMIEVKEKLSRVHTQMEKNKLEKELEALAVKYDEERRIEITEKLASGIPRYGPEAATLREELDVITQREEKRKAAKEEEAKKKADKPKTNKAREDKKDGKGTPKKDGKTTPKNKSTENLAPKSETQIKLDKLKERKRMLEEAEKEKNKAAHGHGRHVACVAEAVTPFVPGTSFGKPGASGNNSRANTASRMGKKMAKDEFEGMGATSKRDNWRPPKHLKKHKCEDKMSKKKSWAVQFKEFRVFAECVLDYLRSQGMNAHFVLRIATDRDWAADVRAQSYWLEETNRVGKCNHYMYRGEAVFFARFDEGNWKFGLKDLAISSGKTGISTKYPLEGKDYFHASNCDTHNAYHQAMTKGAKMLEKERERKKEAADANTKAGGDISISDGSSEISGVPKDREKPHDISNH